MTHLHWQREETEVQLALAAGGQSRSHSGRFNPGKGQVPLVIEPRRTFRPVCTAWNILLPLGLSCSCFPFFPSFCPFYPSRTCISSAPMSLIPAATHNTHPACERPHGYALVRIRSPYPLTDRNASRHSTDHAIPIATSALPNNVCHYFSMPICVISRETRQTLGLLYNNRHVESFCIIELNTFCRTRARKFVQDLRVVDDISNQFNHTNIQAPNLVVRLQTNKRNC